MSKITEKAAAALDLLPEELREPAVAYLLEQAEKFQALQAEVDQGMKDVEAGRVREWKFDEFLRRARSAR
jgi:predicted transcriptional regulator